MMFLKGIAYEYGVKAFNSNKPCVPALDKEYLNDLIAGLNVGEGIKWHKDWIKGWTKSSLK